MDVQNQRILLVGIEVRRLDDPTLHLRSAGRLVPDLLDRSQPLAHENVVVYSGDAGLCGTFGHRVPHNVRRLVGRGADTDGGLATSHRRQRQHMRTRRDLMVLPVRRDVVDVLGPSVTRREVHAIGLLVPVKRPDVAVERTRNQTCVRAVRSHDVHFGRLVRLRGPVEAGEGDLRPVGGDDRAGPGPPTLGQLADGAGLDVESPDVRLQVREISVFHEPIEDERATVGRDVVARSTDARHESGADMKVTPGELHGSATVGRHAEEVVPPVRQKADPVESIVHAIDDSRCGCPLGSRRSRGKINRPGRCSGNDALEVQVPPVRCPLDVRRRLGLVRDLADRAFGVHPAHEELRPSGSPSAR